MFIYVYINITFGCVHGYGCNSIHLEAFVAFGAAALARNAVPVPADRLTLRVEKIWTSGCDSSIREIIPKLSDQSGLGMFRI